MSQQSVLLGFLVGLRQVGFTGLGGVYREEKLWFCPQADGGWICWGLLAGQKAVPVPARREMKPVRTWPTSEWFEDH
jgi:hypothetical protein